MSVDFCSIFCYVFLLNIYFHVACICQVFCSLDISKCLQVVANFSASWCGPCRMIAPLYCELSEKHPSLMFLTVDVDELTVSTYFLKIFNLKIALSFKHELIFSHESGIQHVLGYQSNPDLLLPQRWTASRQIGRGQQAGIAEEDNSHCRYWNAMPEIALLLLCSFMCYGQSGLLFVIICLFMCKCKSNPVFPWSFWPRIHEKNSALWETSMLLDQDDDFHRLSFSFIFFWEFLLLLFTWKRAVTGWIRSWDDR